MTIPYQDALLEGGEKNCNAAAKMTTTTTLIPVRVAAAAQWCSGTGLTTEACPTGLTTFKCGAFHASRHTGSTCNKKYSEASATKRTTYRSRRATKRKLHIHYLGSRTSIDHQNGVNQCMVFSPPLRRGMCRRAKAGLLRANISPIACHSLRT